MSNRLTRAAWPVVHWPIVLGPILLWLGSGGLAWAASQEVPPPDSPEAASGQAEYGPPLVADAAMPEGTDTTCVNPGSDADAWIDKVEKGVYGGVCGTALWFDGLFGNLRYDQETDETFGRLGVFEKYDDRDGFDTDVRLRARFALPNLSRRLRLVVGRGDEQTLLEERPTTGQGQAPSSFQTVEDDAWLLGLGYSKRSGLENGFDFGAGVRLNTPVDPYVKASYRHNFIFRGDTMLRFRETPFWRDSRGWGATTQISLDHLATDRVLLRWNNIGTVAQDTEALEWGTDVSAYQSLGGAGPSATRLCCVARPAPTCRSRTTASKPATGRTSSASGCSWIVRQRHLAPGVPGGGAQDQSRGGHRSRDVLRSDARRGVALTPHGLEG